MNGLQLPNKFLQETEVEVQSERDEDGKARTLSIQNYSRSDCMGIDLTKIYLNS